MDVVLVVVRDVVLVVVRDVVLVVVSRAWFRASLSAQLGRNARHWRLK